jgi:hypothetical protein
MALSARATVRLLCTVAAVVITAIALGSISAAGQASQSSSRPATPATPATCHRAFGRRRSAREVRSRGFSARRRRSRRHGPVPATRPRRAGPIPRARPAPSWWPASSVSLSRAARPPCTTATQRGRTAITRRSTAPACTTVGCGSWTARPGRRSPTSARSRPRATRTARTGSARTARASPLGHLYERGVWQLPERGADGGGWAAARYRAGRRARGLPCPG